MLGAHGFNLRTWVLNLIADSYFRGITHSLNKQTPALLVFPIFSVYIMVLFGNLIRSGWAISIFEDGTSAASRLI